MLAIDDSMLGPRDVDDDLAPAQPRLAEVRPPPPLGNVMV